MSITNWQRQTTMDTNIPIPTSASGCSITRPGLWMMALLSSRHKTSLPYWDFQLTPFSYLSNSPHLVLLAPLRSAKHVIPVHATLQLSTGSYSGASSLAFHMTVGGLYANYYTVPVHRLYDVSLYLSLSCYSRSCCCG